VDELIPAHPTALIADPGRVGPHYEGQASEWIILLRGPAGVLEVFSLEVSHREGLDDPESTIAKAEERLRVSGYRVG